jgi:hypothetical protein
LFDIIDDESEFKPLDTEQAEFLVSLAEDLKSLGQDLDDSRSQVCEVAANNIMRLTALAMAGFHLYKDYREHSESMFADLVRAVIQLEELKPGGSEHLQDGAMLDYSEFLKDMTNEYD